MRLTILSLAVMALLAGITGCGIKPSKVDPPPSVRHDTFPKTYPDPETDPKPKP
jgi:hypothetical protein